ncbi:histidinol-phosphate aminotransferase [Candidatus Nasuia deltocephalinicola str. NAS-ALF]|uniref:Histidinol-phosphate aminotransferase n=1 Tax=Candidatus Nasuia deltocephalinicola str. NAS-ALF TaxID=1343077 RepID=S5SQJ4_9PROT|nr:histidinol-phosphate aminotransferase [Candidatus Nasuia deltocephalinicola str. NAS-ALF]
MNKLLQIKPYKQGKQPNIFLNLKLNTNENPYHVNISTIKEIIKEIKFFGNILKYYPDPDSYIVINELSKYYNVKYEEIFIGNGSDDVLSNVFLTFFKNKKILYLSDLTYSFYESFIKLYKIRYKILKINKNFSINIKKIKKNNNLIINNPNAPTGKKINEIKIKILILNRLSVLVIDETYIDFNNKSLVNLIKIKKNVIIIKTFSKFKSLAGLRIGFALSNEYMIKFMNSTKNSINSYPINIISQISVKNIIKNNNYFEKIKIKIFKNKLLITKNLKKLNFNIIESETNFILISNRNLNINKLCNYLNKKNIFIRKFDIPKIENFARVTVGKKEDCILLINNIRNFIKL